MGEYDYKIGKERIKEILDNELQVIENNKIPSNDNFTFSNAYYGWVTGIFIDIRDSSDLFTKEDKELVIKAGRKDTGINNQVWIGDAVSKASTLSTLGTEYVNIVEACSLK
ncbi:MAG: hypothetical protein HQ557_02145 [Bacteroidetes bacterium]|nr:hypothetical protein [Bacteroidota bacterium]